MNVVLIAMMATLSMQVGYFMWKLSASTQPRFGSTSAGVAVLGLLRDWRWLTGLAATVAGWLLFIKATAIGDISLVQPLMTVGDVFLILMAVVFLHERLSTYEWFGIVLTVFGAACLAADASTSAAATANAGRLGALMALAAAAAAGLLRAAKHGARAELSLALTVGLAFGCGATLTKALTTRALASGTVNLNWTIVLDPLLAAIVGANAIGLILLQVAFQRGRVAIIVPIQLAVTNCVAVAGGMLVFMEQVSPLRWFGIGVILAGTAVLHQGKA